MSGIKAVSIMQGTGGASVGLQNGGIETIGFLEMNEEYGRPCRLNWPDKIHTTSTEEWEEYITDWDGVDIVYANPPCQGLTGANKNSSADHWKNRLFIDAVATAVRMHPKIIILENIPRMLTMGAKIVDEATNVADSAGYNMSWHRHRAGDFGVSQKRDRIMFVLEQNPTWWPSHDKQRPATVGEAIGDLYDVAVDYDGDWVEYSGPPLCDYQRKLRTGLDGEQLTGTWNHAFVKVPEHHEVVPQGGTWLQLDDDQLTEKEVNRRKAGSIFNAAEIHRLHEEKYAGTVTGMWNKMHPTQTRHISVREASRLMGFPDWWRWPDSWNLAQMAAGVCPPVTEWFAEAIVHRFAGTQMEPPVGQLF